MKKVFLGEALISERNEFAGREGDMIQTWKLGVMLNDDKGVTFSISSRDTQLYDYASRIEVGQYVRIEADPAIRQDGRIKYRVSSLELVENQGS